MEIAAISYISFLGKVFKLWPLYQGILNSTQVKNQANLEYIASSTHQHTPLYTRDFLFYEKQKTRPLFQAVLNSNRDMVGFSSSGHFSMNHI